MQRAVLHTEFEFEFDVDVSRFFAFGGSPDLLFFLATKVFEVVYFDSRMEGTPTKVIKMM